MFFVVLCFRYMYDALDTFLCCFVFGASTRYVTLLQGIHVILTKRAYYQGLYSLLLITLHYNKGCGTLNASDIAPLR